MFDSLSSRIQNAFTALKGEVRLTEAQVEDVLREIRLALLEADVNFNVVKAFIDRVRDRAMDQAVLRSLSPAQQVLKIVRDELLALFAGTEGGRYLTHVFYSFAGLIFGWCEWRKNRLVAIERTIGHFMNNRHIRRAQRHVKPAY